jgi:hypothetical protein
MENPINDTENLEEPQSLDVVHISVGSAATGIHYSMDIRIDDPAYVSKVDDLLDKWQSASIAVARRRLQLKS